MWFYVEVVSNYEKLDEVKSVFVFRVCRYLDGIFLAFRTVRGCSVVVLSLFGL